MAANSKTILWFRRDLRIDDNPALAAAAKDGRVLPVYIWCPKEEAPFYPGRVSRWWLNRSLAHLDQSLRCLGAAVTFIKAENTLAALLHCVHATGATKIVYNLLYDPISLLRDHNIKQKLEETGILMQSFNGDLLHKPWEVHDEAGHAYTTFNPYWDKCLSKPIETCMLLPPLKLLPAAGITERCSIEELGLEDVTEAPSNIYLEKSWYPGWSNADEVLTQFLEHDLVHYSRNKMKVDGISTSLLSPYLHFGELSVRKVFYHVRLKQIQWAMDGNFAGEESASHFLRAIGVREYSRYLCFNFPFTHERPVLEKLEYFPWRADQDNFKAWRLGQTGYPLVDAGMRALLATGWVHNRIRVIVSSFLVKVLLLPWKWGLKYFWESLLDADLEIDTLGWQYISGCLPDGHQLNHLDSPEVQGKKYDPEGDYVRKWLPQLARMPNEWIHCPWDAPLAVLRAAGVEFGVNYPKPVIEIEIARLRLNNAVSVMLESEAASRNSNAKMVKQFSVRNFNNNEKLGNGGIVFRERVAHSTNLSYNQRASNLFEHNVNDKAVETTTDEQLGSTAESSLISKQNFSGNQFSAPVKSSIMKRKASSLDNSSNPRNQFSDTFMHPISKTKTFNSN